MAVPTRHTVSPAPGTGPSHGSVPTTPGASGQWSSAASLPAHLGLLKFKRAFQGDTLLVNPILIGLQRLKPFTSERVILLPGWANPDPLRSTEERRSLGTLGLPSRMPSGTSGKGICCPLLTQGMSGSSWVILRCWVWMVLLVLTSPDISSPGWPWRHHSDLPHLLRVPRVHLRITCSL